MSIRFYVIYWRANAVRPYRVAIISPRMGDLWSPAHFIVGTDALGCPKNTISYWQSFKIKRKPRKDCRDFSFELPYTYPKRSLSHSCEACKGERAKHHFRVPNKVAVYLVTLLRFFRGQPLRIFRICVYLFFTLTKKEYIIFDNKLQRIQVSNTAKLNFYPYKVEKGLHKHIALFTESHAAIHQ